MFLFTHTATTEIYTLSLHDALPISLTGTGGQARLPGDLLQRQAGLHDGEALQDLADLLQDQDRRDAALVAIGRDRKSTRLNSSHSSISYAVFCLKKKTNFLPSCRLS